LNDESPSNHQAHRPRPEDPEEHLEASWTGRVSGKHRRPDGDLFNRDRKDSDRYSAHCPDVLGCAAVGKTVETVVANMKQALELHFEGMVEDGDAVPRPRGLDSYREVMKDLDLNEYFLAHVQIDTSRFAAWISRP
jgi:predicted RNase H-like HicB family nuclease